MNAPERIFLPDIQSLADERALAIQQVGVRGVRYPLALAGAVGGATVADFTLTVGLRPEARGTHMSRFIELLERPREPLSVNALPALLGEMLDRLDAETGAIAARFPYFVRKRAPLSGVESLLDHDAGWRVARDETGVTSVELEVRVPVTSLCPCSKEISDYGAHNQRSHVTVRATLRDGAATPAVSLDELIRYAEESASCEVYGLLKRPDEKWVTEQAYDNPKFVEDLVRDVALRLIADVRIARWSVTAENFESIHNHSAYAEIAGRND